MKTETQGATDARRAAKREYNRLYRAANLEALRERDREYHAANREKRRLYDIANREKRRAQQRARVAANRERSRAHARKYYEANREKVCQRMAARFREDEGYRLTHLLRCRMRNALARGHRAGSAVRDLGMPIAEFKARLESQFLPGMTWENWGSGPGSWQIDHVYPLAAADLTDRAQLLAACNYRNLQPLWFADNLAKGDSVSPEAQALFDELVSLFRGGAR